MKCELIVEREIMEFQPGTAPPLRMAPLALVEQCERRGKHLVAPIGTVIDDPQSFWIVKMGQAKPLDEECALAAGQTPEQWAASVQAARRLAAGIDPKDFELFDKGIILGYESDGSYRPGPNWDQHQPEQAAPASGATTDIDI